MKLIRRHVDPLSFTRLIPYEQRLASDSRWALTEGSIFFEGKGQVQASLLRIAARLNELGIPYAVVGGLALFQHGVRRFTEDVDILVTREALKLIHEKLEGLGYVPPFAGSKNLRDVENGVKIEFILTGAYPGDGKEKPVTFPDPVNASFERDGVRYINLELLVELKLASGMTGSGRQKDLGDVVALVKELDLPLDFAQRLNPYVRAFYTDLWGQARRRYVRIWRTKSLIVEANSLEENAAILKSAAKELQRMLDDGVIIEPKRGTADDHAILITTDPKIAAKYDMHAEEDLWEEGDEGARH